jgi:large repetitive protein
MAGTDSAALHLDLAETPESPQERPEWLPLEEMFSFFSFLLRFLESLGFGDVFLKWRSVLCAASTIAFRMPEEPEALAEGGGRHWASYGTVFGEWGWRFAMQRNLVSILALLSMCVTLAAQPVGRFALPDADGDGHPLFGTPQVRPNFDEVNGVSVRAHATSVAFGDVDGDGDVDAIVTNAKLPGGAVPYSYATLMLNAGDGIFGPPVVVREGFQAVMAVLADVNADGLADICLTDAGLGGVVILISTGGGSFAPEVVYPVGINPRSLVLADFDGDSDLDIAALNHESADVSTLLNRGDGSFEPEQRVDPGAPIARGLSNMDDAYPGPFLAAGDLTGDGVVDLAVPGSQEVMILVGDGSGGFAASVLSAKVIGKRAYDIEIADLDGDGDADMAVAVRAQTATIEVLINKGGGFFDPSVGYEALWDPDPNSRPVTVSVADVDDDGDPDIAVGYTDAAGVTVLHNAGDGTFHRKSLYHAIEDSWTARFEDVNGDALPDLAVLTDVPGRTGAHRSMLRVLFNVGRGRLLEHEGTPAYLTAATVFPWKSPTSVLAADIDADGDEDLVVTNWTSDIPTSVNLMFNDGAGVFAPITPITLGPIGESGATHAAAADVNNDGILDLVVADNTHNNLFADGSVWILVGKGGGAFEAPFAIKLPGLVPEHIGTGDFDGDGDIDLAVWAAEPITNRSFTLIDRMVVIMLNDGRGGFTIDARHLIGTAVWLWSSGTMAVGDFDQDGDLDLAATMGPEFSDAKLAVLINDGAGEFAMKPIIVIGYAPRSSITLDYDGDGDLDLAVGHNVNNTSDKPYITLLNNDGSANFVIERELFDVHLDSAGSLTTSDIDQDGDADLLMQTQPGVIVHLNDGTGKFGPFVSYGAGNGASSLAIGDIDNDGRLDLVTGDWADNNVNVLRNVGEFVCYADCDKSTGAGVLDVFDFLCFQDSFVNGEPFACDCDTSTGVGVCDFFDFLCFQRAFASGCP